MTIGAQQENDRDQLGEEPARNDRSPRWRRGWCVESGDPIVYGQVDGGLVFIPVEKAKRLAGIYAALKTAKTWGEL